MRYTTEMKLSGTVEHDGYVFIFDNDDAIKILDVSELWYRIVTLAESQGEVFFRAKCNFDEQVDIPADL